MTRTIVVCAKVIRTIMARTKLCRLGRIVLVLACVAEARQNSTAAQPKACSEPEQKQLDFWVGEWDLTWPGNNAGETGHGTNSVGRILDGASSRKISPVAKPCTSGQERLHL